MKIQNNTNKHKLNKNKLVLIVDADEELNKAYDSVSAAYYLIRYRLHQEKLSNKMRKILDLLDETQIMISNLP